MNKSLNVLMYLFIIFSFVGCLGGDSKLGSKDNPIKLYFTPSVDAESIASNSVEFLKYMEKETGLFFKSGIPTSYVAVVEAFGSNRADVAVMNSFGYLMANQKYGATANLTVIRFGDDSYRGQIITHVDSGITDVKSLKGKKFAFTDPSSTSGYLLPLKILKEKDAEPGNIIFGTKHDNVVTMVYQKQVDAGATYYSPPAEDGSIRDARMRVKTQFPDVESKVKIIELTDEIKNDPFVFRKDLSKDIVNKVVSAVKKFLTTENGKTIFKEIYGVDGVIDAKDSDYDSLREMLKVVNINPKDLIKK